MIIGAISGILQFAQNFTRSVPKILALEKVKLAIKEVGNLTVVWIFFFSLIFNFIIYLFLCFLLIYFFQIKILSGSLNQPDCSLSTDLEKIYGALEFFNGPFNIIQKVVVLFYFILF